MEPHGLEQFVRHVDISTQDGLKKALLRLAKRADMVEKHCGLLPAESERGLKVYGGAEVEGDERPEFKPHFLGPVVTDSPLVESEDAEALQKRHPKKGK